MRSMMIRTTAGSIPFNRLAPTFHPGPVGADVAPEVATVAILAMAPFLLAQKIGTERRIRSGHRHRRDSLPQDPLDATVDVVGTSLPLGLQRQDQPVRCTQNG